MDSTIDPLSVPHNDVMEMKKTLQKMDFKVFAYFDLDHEETLLVLKKICEMLVILGPGVLLFFYYSGHGFRYEQVDYIAPVDLYLSEIDCAECISSIDITESFQKTCCKVFAFFDCCRNRFSSKIDVQII